MSLDEREPVHPVDNGQNTDFKEENKTISPEKAIGNAEELKKYSLDSILSGEVPGSLEWYEAYDANNKFDGIVEKAEKTSDGLISAVFFLDNEASVDYINDALNKADEGRKELYQEMIEVYELLDEANPETSNEFLEEAIGYMREIENGLSFVEGLTGVRAGDSYISAKPDSYNPDSISQTGP